MSNILEIQEVEKRYSKAKSTSLFITCALQLWVLFCQTLGGKVTAETESHMPTLGKWDP